MNSPAHRRAVGIDVDREKVLSFVEAARFVGRLQGKNRVALQTLHRWATKGCRGVRLDTIFVGGARCTSLEALQRFIADVTRARGVTAAPTFADGAARNLGDVEAILRDAGISGDAGEP